MKSSDLSRNKMCKALRDDKHLSLSIHSLNHSFINHYPFSNVTPSFIYICFQSRIICVGKLYSLSVARVQMLANQQKMFGGILEENCGSLNLSLQYNADLSLLTVRLIRAQDLVPREGQSGLDPYCRLRLLPDRRHQLHSKVRSIAARSPIRTHGCLLRAYNIVIIVIIYLFI